MKTINTIIFLFIFLSLTSCNSCVSGGSTMDRCIEGLLEEGYSYSDAKDECESMREESQIRR